MAWLFIATMLPVGGRGRIVELSTIFVLVAALRRSARTGRRPALTAAARQDVALKDLMPKGMAIGVAINQRQIAGRYAVVFRVFLKHREAVTRVTFCGLSDADSWLNRGRMNYPLLWDRERRPKPAFDAVVEVLRNAR